MRSRRRWPPRGAEPAGAVCEAQGVAVEVELLWWRGCPSWERALAMLREEMEAAGLDPGSVAVTEIAGEADAARRDFPGSPTILIGGRDLQPPGPDAPRGLSCRVYRRRDGRVSPLPDRAALHDALRAAAARESEAA
jgi:hypothetical protein